jgi:hypothetical protein
MGGAALPMGKVTSEGVAPCAEVSSFEEREVEGLSSDGTGLDFPEDEAVSTEVGGFVGGAVSFAGVSIPMVTGPSDPLETGTARRNFNTQNRAGSLLTL